MTSPLSYLVGLDGRNSFSSMAIAFDITEVFRLGFTLIDEGVPLNVSFPSDWFGSCSRF